MSDKPLTLDCAGRMPSAADLATFQRTRIIYAIGVGAACLWQFFTWASWHPLPQMEPEFTEVSVVMQVVGGTALIWLVMGLRRIILSPIARRDVITWVLVGMNVAAVLIGLAFRVA